MHETPLRARGRVRSRGFEPVGSIPEGSSPWVRPRRLRARGFDPRWVRSRAVRSPPAPRSTSPSGGRCSPCSPRCRCTLSSSRTPVCLVRLRAPVTICTPATITTRATRACSCRKRHKTLQRHLAAYRGISVVYLLNVCRSFTSAFMPHSAAFISPYAFNAFEVLLTIASSPQITRI